MKRIFTKILAIVLCLMCIFSMTACGDDDSAEVIKPAQFGSYGADFARLLAKTHPFRKAYSDGEISTGIMIKEEFEKLGYTVETQSFKNIYGSESYNYVVHIQGDGFIKVNENNNASSEVRRLVVIGAHYDNAYKSTEVPEGYSYDGISDNASAIGCLMTLASELKNYDKQAFDIDIVAFGASADDFAGARTYYNSLSSDEKNRIEVMYCIENIFAGDKMYANAGWNSLVHSQKYKMRRKLYQAYDVAYNDMLSSLNGYNLLYNESGIITDVNGDGIYDIYREVSINTSDYRVFDENNIPIVFFDSGDYFFDSIDATKETKNLNLQEFGGKVSNTYLDSTALLDDVMKSGDKDVLEIRINNTAYVILESLKKGSDFAMTREEYEEYLKTPSVTPEATTTAAVQ